jgi:hypothetical protein
MSHGIGSNLLQGPPLTVEVTSAPQSQPEAEPHKSLHVTAQINTHLLLSRAIKREGVLFLAKQWDLHKRKEGKRHLISEELIFFFCTFNLERN